MDYTANIICHHDILDEMVPENFDWENWEGSNWELYNYIITAWKTTFNPKFEILSMVDAGEGYEVGILMKIQGTKKDILDWVKETDNEMWLPEGYTLNLQPVK